MTEPKLNLWRRKVIAFLHDPPFKTLDPMKHAALRGSLLQILYGSGGQKYQQLFDRLSDHVSAAADRVILPRWDNPTQRLAVKPTAFHHPLGYGRLPLNDLARDRAVKDMTTALEELVDPLKDDLRNLDVSDPVRAEKLRFWLLWRFWPDRCAQKSPSYAYLPADSRIPDHTIWTHDSITSALQSCVGVTSSEAASPHKQFSPAFLIFQIGPVQEFIRQARTTRDLWSGSFLLSWLMAHALAYVALRWGPDMVLMPSLRCQPLFDFLCSRDLPEVYRTLQPRPEDVMTPTIPHRMVCLVPQAEAETIARQTAEKVRATLTSLSEGCWKKLVEANPHRMDSHELEQAERRWRSQIDQFLTIHWCVWPWGNWGDDMLQATMDLFGQIPAGRPDPTSGDRIGPAEALRCLYDIATQKIPDSDADPRCYRTEPPGSRNLAKRNGRRLVDNPGIAWAAHYALAEFYMSCRRHTRNFERWGAVFDDKGQYQPRETAEFERRRYGSVKDALSGREEIIGTEEWQENLPRIRGHVFRRGDRLGAMNLMKRVWYQKSRKKEDSDAGLPGDPPRFASVPSVAAAAWLSDNEEKLAASPRLPAFMDAARAVREEMPGIPADSSPREWLRKADPAIFHLPHWDRLIEDLREDLARRDDAQEASAARLQAARKALADLLQEVGAPPVYFAVLAMDGDDMGKTVSGARVPRWKELLCGEAQEYFRRIGAGELLEQPRVVSPSFHLQFSEALSNFAHSVAARVVEHFQGQLIYAGGDDVLAMLPAEKALLCARALRLAFRGDPTIERIVPSLRGAGAEGFLRVGDGPPVLVPGRGTDISAGIAVGHMHSPLQNLVRVASEALHRAKESQAAGGYGKSAFVTAVYKGSGEVLQWGAKWDGLALEVMEQYRKLREKGILSGRFPYVLADRLRRYEDRSGTQWRIRQSDRFDPFEVFRAELEFIARQQGNWRDGKDGTYEDFVELLCCYLGDFRAIAKKASDRPGQQRLEQCSCRHRKLDDFLGPLLTEAFLHRRGGEQ